MAFFLAMLAAAFLGYLYGHRIRPDKKLQQALQEIRTRGMAILEEGRRGVYKTMVTDQQRSSELVVEVKALAVTTGGQVKVQYISAFYRNPDFRTNKGEALRAEVQDLLGTYLPENEIEWYENKDRQDNIREFLRAVEAVQTKKLA